MLRNLLPQGWGVKDALKDLAELTEWAVEARYPGDWPDATHADAGEALQDARAVVKAILADLGTRGSQTGG
ncbi:MAG TPA: HEPN domain-containing protein [Phycisphaerae bacterium]|nr:HEPN domain-containing protein [Phycisphaerae bacterium]